MRETGNRISSGSGASVRPSLQAARIPAALLIAAFLAGGAGCRKSEPAADPPRRPASAGKPRVEKPDKPARTPSPKSKPRDPAELARLRKPGPRARSIAQAKVDPSRAGALHKQLDALRQRQRENLSRDTGLGDGPVADLLRAYQDAQDEDQRLNALNNLAGRDDPQAEALLRQAAAEAEAAERAAALELLAEQARAEHLPLAAAALDSPDPDLQAAGLWLLRHIASEAALPVWNRAISHPSVEVTQAAMEQLSEAPAFLQVPVARQALARNQPWLTEQALALLGGITSKTAVEALIPYLEHPVSADLAQSGLFFLLSQHFDTVEDAQKWWQANHQRLGSDLQPLELQ